MSQHAVSSLIAAVCAVGASAGRAADVVPVRFIDGLPVIEAQLGAIRAEFLLDTGGQIGITVPQPLINGATGVQLGAERRLLSDAAGNTYTVQSLVATSLRLGTTELGPIDGDVNFQWGLSFGPGDEPEVTKLGAVGFDALSARNVLLDLGARRIVLFDKGGSDRLDTTGWQSVPFTYDDAGIVIQIAVDGAKASMSLDTGASISALRKDAKLFGSTTSPCRGKPPATLFCGVKRLNRVRAGSVNLGHLDVGVLEMNGVPFDGILGIDFFLARKVFIDVDANEIFIQPGLRRGPVR
jgi:hypothetical protein